jgi:hypothetical protein
MEVYTMDNDRTNVIVASAWMVGISVLLFFLPLVNGLIGGVVGGYKAGTPKRGIIAAVIPSLIVAAALWAIFAVFGGPVMGFFAGAAAGMLVLLADIGLFIGALIGGYFAQSRGPNRIIHA